uniref:Tetratricopeptide repeat-containing protein n=1 Tax=Candidatus Kentrum eta TaxID=2126337 RepID=A0A450VCH5_9GAMM|nr:MAG: Tetratricopeptide repeat-containing protein [Candidatus Kentron sp. H]VFK02634.1 MAG: Tetratricopeptide repeat-containing protein [Candidatus Kentron sp. H]VFK05534.1 MAG: Tetratricopeptide repeat-containing protein [Candidatus Kentron sp. H]
MAKIPENVRVWIIGLLFLTGFGITGITTAQNGAKAESLAPATVDKKPDEKASLIPIPMPNLDRVEDAVKKHLQVAHRDLVELQSDPNVTKWGLGEAYGELGRLYHAHRLYDAAEACYRNAEKLLIKDTRWPYLLGYLYQQQARLEEAVPNYQRTLVLYPSYAPAQLRLAQVLFGTGRADEAVHLLKQVSSAPEFRGAAAFWLGKAVLAKGQYAKAVKWLTLAGSEQPAASQIHYPLAMAYRGLGEIDAARHHLKQRGEIEPAIPDPMVEELSELLTGVRTRQYQAMKAIWAHRFDVAAKEFQAILEHNPSNILARVSLGRCLYLLGKPDGAKRELRLVLKQEPDHDKANYFLGRLLWEQGQEGVAMAHFRTSLKTNPEHAGARFFLASGLMQKGDFEQSAYHFGKVTEALPEDLVARQRESMALIATGVKAHGRALDRITEALLIHPEETVLTQQLTWILAASPDPDVRDGQRALTLAVELFTWRGSIENAEIVAMAYAELGQFNQAVAYQQSAIETVANYGYQYGGVELFERLKTNLALYLAKQPYRIP